MDKKTECEIVQDLLFGYTDGVLKPESKKLVEKHLSECKACQEKLKEITNDIKQEERSQEKEIDYLKKIRIKSKIKSIIMAIGIIIFILFFLYLKNFIILNTITNKTKKSLESENFYQEKRQITKDGIVSVNKLYYKDGNYKRVYEIYSDAGLERTSLEYGKVGSDETISIYDNEKQVYVYKGKVQEIMNQVNNVKWSRFIIEDKMPLNIKLSKAFNLSVDTRQYDNGKECYVIKKRFDKEQKWELWIDKETGLMIKEVNRESRKSYIPNTDIVKEVSDDIEEYRYKCDCVTDEDVKIPDYDGYTVEYVDTNFNKK